MIGLGMSLTGACPGTVLVQATAGIGRSRLLACSSLLAGVVWVKWKPYLTRQPMSQSKDGSVMAATGWPARTIVFGYEMAMLAAIAATLAVAPRSSSELHVTAPCSWWSPHRRWATVLRHLGEEARRRKRRVRRSWKDLLECCGGKEVQPTAGQRRLCVWTDGWILADHDPCACYMGGLGPQLGAIATVHPGRRLPPHVWSPNRWRMHERPRN
jgi:hypothetical protein